MWQALASDGEVLFAIEELQAVHRGMITSLPLSEKAAYVASFLRKLVFQPHAAVRCKKKVNSDVEATRSLLDVARRCDGDGAIGGGLCLGGAEE